MRLPSLALSALVLAVAPAPEASVAPRNIIIILSDDHRYDFMGFMPGAPEWLETPALDRMAAEGMHLANAFVTTALCSPSRASILTGRYAHRHGVVDNTSPIPDGTVFFPTLLQRAGYATAYVGKWHMGEDRDDPQPGFDHWVSFRGQGRYEDPELNVNGSRGVHRGYTTEILTRHATAWLRRQRGPFFLVLSHKAVHAEFVPAPRDRGRYAGRPVPYPVTMAATPENTAGLPDWVRAQRSSWHGVDFMYHGQMQFDEFYRRYAETLLALDRGVGAVLDVLEETGLDRSTLVLYLGDNGFSLGEHGLIDKRHAYEESMRVPMLAWAPGHVTPGTVAPQLVRNIDIAPTVLELAGVACDGGPCDMDGRSFLPVLAGDTASRPTEMLYEYYWEDAFPHTPTVLALRDDRYKYIYYHGVWDDPELFDLEADPLERRNLIDDPAHADRVTRMRTRLFALLADTDGMQIPLRRPTGWRADSTR